MRLVSFVQNGRTACGVVEGDQLPVGFYAGRAGGAALGVRLVAHPGAVRVHVEDRIGVQGLLERRVGFERCVDLQTVDASPRTCDEASIRG